MTIPRENEQEVIGGELTFTEFETFTMECANVTIAPINGSTVMCVESRIPRDDGVYEAKCIVVRGDCHINDCRQDAEELGIDLLKARILANRPDTKHE